jgi:hypothetical protein
MTYTQNKIEVLPPVHLLDLPQHCRNGWRRPFWIYHSIVATVGGCLFGIRLFFHNGQQNTFVCSARAFWSKQNGYFTEIIIGQKIKL